MTIYKICQYILYILSTKVMILFWSKDIHQREEIIKKHIKDLRKIKKFGFVDIAPYRIPGLVIEYFEDYISDEAIIKWKESINWDNMPSWRDFKEILHAIWEWLKKNSNLPSEIIEWFLQDLQSNQYLDLANSNRPNGYQIFDDIKNLCHSLLVRYLEHLEQDNRLTWRRFTKYTLLGLWSILGRWFNNIHRLRKPYEHTLSAWIPPELDGYVIINVSDIHIHQNNTLNLDERDEFTSYFQAIKKMLIKKWIDESKVILVIPGDFLTQKSKISDETDRQYALTILPLLNILPWKYRYISFGNHDERHSNIVNLRQWFSDNGYIALDEKGWKSSDIIMLSNNKELQILGIPDHLTRSDADEEYIANITSKTREAIFNIMLVHNLDSVDNFLPGEGDNDSTINNTYIATGHTHRFHANIPIIGCIVNECMLHFKSKYYKWRYQLDNNVHIDNCPWLNNSPLAPARYNADSWATITYLRYNSRPK